MKKVLLYSGGMDSWLIDKLWKPDIRLYVDMDTKYSQMELEQLAKNGDDFKTIKLPLGMWERDDAIIPLRNLYLIMAACNVTAEEDVQICIGATRGDRSLDQSLTFAQMAESLIGYLYSPQHWVPNGKRVSVVMPFKEYTKTDLLMAYLEQGNDLQKAFDESFSCYTPTEDGVCWNCKPCFRKFISFLLAGYDFNDNTKQKVLNYIEQNGIEQEILKGVYGRGTEDNEILRALAMLRGEK